MSAWTLHPQLEADTKAVASLALCDVRLFDDTRFPWLVLIPRVQAVEWTDLDRDAQHRLADEIDRACRVLRDMYRPDKLNVATLGNVVPQMHVHVIARFRADAAWPKPVWGVGSAEPYDADALAATVVALRARLAG